MANKEYEMLFKLNSQVGSAFSGAFQRAQKELADLQRKIDTLNKSQSDIAAYQKQQAAIAKTESKLNNLQAQYDNIQREMDETGDKSADMQNKLLAKQLQIDNTGKSLKKQTEKLEEMSEALKKAGIKTDDLAAESEKLKRQISELRDEEENFGSTGAMAFDTVASAISAAGISAALREVYDYLAACSQASMDFETAITGVAKTTDLTDEELAEMSASIKAMSTEIPATTTEIAAVAEAAGQLGIQKDALLDFSEVMVMLGTATNMTADEAATALARFSNITGMSEENYDRLGAVIVDLGNKFATTESEITEMSTRLASAGTLAGLSEANIMALAASMSSVGIEAEAGGTAMTQTLSAIEKAVVKSGSNLTEFARISGMSADEFSAAWKTDAMSALTAFIHGLGQLDEDGESTVLVLEELGLSGIRQSNMLKSLALAADKMTSAVDTANTAWEENVALTNEANKRYGTAQSQLIMMQNAYKNVQAAIGDAYNPTLKSLYALLTDILTSVEGFISKNPELVRGVTALVGTFLSLASALATVAAAVKAFKLLNLAALFTGPTGAILGTAAAVSALVGVSAAFTDAAENEAEEVRKLSEASRKQYSELQQAKQEYEEVCELYGETSAHAKTLSKKVNELNEAYESGKQTVSEYHEQFQQSIDGINDGLKSYREAYDEAGQYEDSTFALAERLRELAAQNEKTAETQEEMKIIISALNQAVPELALNYEDVASGAWDSVDAIEELIKARAAEKMYESAAEGATNALTAQIQAERELTAATENRSSAQERYNAALAAWNKYSEQFRVGSGLFGGSEASKFSSQYKELKAAEEALKSYKDEVASAKKTYDAAASEYRNYIGELAELTDAMDNSDEAEAAGKSTVQGYIDAANGMLSQVRTAYGNVSKVASAALSTTHITSTGASRGGKSGGFASGTKSAPPGVALVGEEGPELVYFHGGEQVFTAEETSAMLNGLSADIQAVSLSPLLMQALSAYSGSAINADTGSNAASAPVSVSVTFQIDGNVSPDIAERLYAYGDEFAESVRKVIEDVNADNARRVYR